MKLKEGGGNQLQPYDPNNGRYIDETKNDNDITLLLSKKLFNCKIDEKIPFPKYGVHDDNYAKLYICYCVDFENLRLDDEKFLNYLFKPRPKDDKSKLLNNYGYEIDQWQDLREQLIKGTDFKVKGSLRYKMNVYSFATYTYIENKLKGKKEKIITIWSVEPNNSLRFVTIKLGEITNETRF